MIKPGIGNEIRNEMGNEMTILYQINVSKYLEGKKERRNTKGERARVYYRGIKNGRGGLGYQMTRRVKSCAGYIVKSESGP